MSRNVISVNIAVVHVAIVLFLVNAGSSAASPCQSLIDLENGGAHSSAGATAHFRVRLPATGVLTVELSHAARVEVVACGETTADVLVAERSTRHVVLAARTAGAVVLRVATVAPRFHVATHFATAALVAEDLELGGLPVRRTHWIAARTLTKGDPEDVYPDPDGLRSGERPLASFLTMEASLVLKGDPEDVYPDPDGLVCGAPSGD